MPKTIKALVGAASGLALFVLAAIPASAGLDHHLFVLVPVSEARAFDLSGTPQATVDLGDGTACWALNSLDIRTAPDPLWWNATSSSLSDVTIGGDDYVVTTTLTGWGTWSGSALTGSVDAWVDLQPDDPSSSAPCDGAGATCAVRAVNILVSGNATRGLSPVSGGALASGDKVSLSGQNSTTELWVVDNGNPPVCGALANADLGHVEIAATLEI